MAFLYTKADGREIKLHSYSGGLDYKTCRQLYYLKRVKGYREKEQRASLDFGKCLESAIQYYHQNGLQPGSCVDEVKRLWLQFKETQFVFSKQEQTWSDAYLMLSDMAKLYEIHLPKLPWKNPRFQINYKKNLWPGTELGDLGDQAFIDLLEPREDGTNLIVDIKTAKAPLDLTPNLLSLDPQLKRYAWITGSPHVAFLWFSKGRPNLKMGDVVSLLQTSGKWTDGDTVSIFKMDHETQEVLVGTAEDIEDADKLLGEIIGKGSTARKEELVQELISTARLVRVPRSYLTKCRLQYVEAYIDAEARRETGEDVGNQILRIQDSALRNFWPRDGGIRWPDDRCKSCAMRGICLKNDNLRDQLVQLKAAPVEVEEDWLAEMEEA